MSLTEIVVHIQTRHHRQVLFASLVLLEQQLRHHCAQSLATIVTAVNRRDRHSVAQHAGTNRMPLRMVSLEQALRRCPVDNLREFPPQIHRILDTEIESLSTD